jgi:general secretion pathway protein L
MKLRVFLPAADRLEEGTALPWQLFGARRELLREGESPLAAMPKAGRVEAIVPAERVLFARLKLPRVNAATIRELLPFAVEDRLLADPAHIHAVAGRTGASGETVVAVVDRDWLAAAISAMARHGLAPAHAWPEGALLAGGNGDWHLVWAPARGMLVDDVGVGATFDHDASGAFPLALRIALDESAGRGERPASIRVHRAAGAPIPDLARWSQDTGLPFSPGGAWEEISRGEPATGSIDLLQGFTRRKSPVAAIPRAAVVLALLLAALQLGFTAIDTWRLGRERDALVAKQESLFRAAFPEAKVVVDPDLQMDRNLAELRRSRGLAGGDEFLARLSEAGRGSTAPARSITYADGKLEVKR